MCCIFALYLANFIAFFDRSTPTPVHFFLSFNIEIIIHPDPVPISRIFFFSLICKHFNACSTKISVSGLGIKTFLLTLKLFFQNSLNPEI